MADEPSYIDYEAFLDPSFSPNDFANTLITSTNNPSDTQLDLSTPLSRVLFDIQEIDTHIHTLTTKSALPLLSHTRNQNDAGQSVLHTVETQVSVLKEGYERLEKDVVRKWENAEEVRGAAERSWATVRLARAVGRCLMLGRQLEGQLLELSPRAVDTGGGSPTVIREDHRALIRASHTLLMLRRMFTTTGDNEEGYGLDRVKVIRTLRSDLVVPAENSIKAKSQQILSRFSVTAVSSDSDGAANSAKYRGEGGSGTTTYAQQEETRQRTISAITTLYLLSPTPTVNIPASDFTPELLLATLKGYIHATVTSSLNPLSRGLSMLPVLDKALLEVSTRCQHIVSLEILLESLKPPNHPFLTYTSDQETDYGERPAGSKTKSNLLQPVLQLLDTTSLPSYFWRSLASSLSPRVQEIVSHGGVSARTLKSNRDRLREDIRACVLRGSQLPNSGTGRSRPDTPRVVGNWEREAAVMISAVLSGLGR